MCFSVAAGVSPAVEPGILPGGTSPRIPQNVAYFQIAEQPGVVSGRQDAALYGSQDGRRYATKHVRRRTIAHGVSRGERAFFHRCAVLNLYTQNFAALSIAFSVV